MSTQNLEVVKVDAARNLILLKGAVPGSAGSWVTIRDAVKRPAPKDAPKPAKLREKTAAASAEAAKGGE